MVLSATLVLLLGFAACRINSDCSCNKLKRNAVDFENVENRQCNIGTTTTQKWEKEFSVDGMSLIPGGKYTIGTSEPIFLADEESPEKIVELADFYLDKYEVSNGNFIEFTEATGYVTEAEKFNDSFIFGGLLTEALRREYKDFRVVQAPWWYKVNGVNWRHPHGPGTSLEDLKDHPVVHVSWNDAEAYCSWIGKRLPTEVEWEAGCRGGKKRKLFPWGNKMLPRDKHWMNIWQGEFPDVNTKDDGYKITCPVDAFRQNDFDLYNIVGNVWEWTSDLWDYKNTALREKNHNANRVKKGGSYLCHQSYCYRYRCAARSQNSQDSSAGNLGFRCAKNLK